MTLHSQAFDLFIFVILGLSSFFSGQGMDERFVVPHHHGSGERVRGVRIPQNRTGENAQKRLKISRKFT